ncbi:unnamed protein product [Rhodiola kirilowii]
MMQPQIACLSMIHQPLIVRPPQMRPPQFQMRGPPPQMSSPQFGQRPGGPPPPSPLDSFPMPPQQFGQRLMMPPPHMMRGLLRRLSLECRDASPTTESSIISSLSCFHSYLGTSREDCYDDLI